MEARFLSRTQNVTRVSDIACKHVLAISLDFDGNVASREYYNLLKAGIDRDTALLSVNRQLIAWMVSAVEKANSDRVVFLVGSNKQDRAHASKCNYASNVDGDCFSVLESLANIVKQELEKQASPKAKKILFDRYLLADSHGNKPCGENFSHSVANDASYDYDAFSFDEYKNNIIFGQTHHLAEIYCNAQIDYYFVDDIESILQSILDGGDEDEDRNIVPKNVNVTLFHHKSSGDHVTESEVKEFGSYQGTYEIDPSYHHRVRFDYTHSRDCPLRDSLTDLQKLFDEINTKILELSYSREEKLFHDALIRFRREKTWASKKIKALNYQHDSVEKIQSLILSYQSQFCKLVEIINQFQLQLHQLRLQITRFEETGKSQPAKCLVDALKKFNQNINNDMVTCLTSVIKLDSDTASVMIPKTLRLLDSLLERLENLNLENNNAKEDLAAILKFQKDYQSDAYLDYLYTIRIPLVFGGLSGLAAIFFALSPTSETSKLNDATRSFGLLFSSLAIIGSAVGIYVSGVEGSLFFHPTYQKTNDDLKNMEIPTLTLDL